MIQIAHICLRLLEMLLLVVWEHACLCACTLAHIWSVHFVLTFWKFITTMFEVVRGWRGLDRAARCECADPCLARCDMLSLREWLVVLQCVVV